MSRSSHPIEHEELMAYLDGELAMERAVAAAAHLERCAECQELAAELRKISQEMMVWEVEEPGIAEISTDIAVALQKRKKEPKRAPRRRGWGMVFTPRRLAWAGGSAAILLLLSFLGVSRLRPARQDMSQSTIGEAQARLEGSAGKDINGALRDQLRTDSYRAEYGKNSGGVTKVPLAAGVTTTYYDSLNRSSQDGQTRSSWDNSASPSPSQPPAKSSNEETQGFVGEDGSEAEDRPGVPIIPMIARTAGLTLTTKEFDKTRAGLEEILKRFHGYLGDLKVSAPAEAGRTLSATLRIPAPQLESAMAELKKLGRVEGESQGGEEVTQQYVDLEARLKNSQHTEQRLTEILRTRTGKLQDILKVELEIDRVRGEIEQMQAEKKELNKRVAFATLNTTVNEEYHARLQAAPPSTGSRFRNAAVDGYNTVVEGLIDVGLFLLSAGPSLLLWAAILFFPARWAWKKVREKTKDADTPSAS